jgi:hypothetical protein
MDRGASINLLLCTYHNVILLLYLRKRHQELGGGTIHIIISQYTLHSTQLLLKHSTQSVKATLM